MWRRIFFHHQRGYRSLAFVLAGLISIATYAFAVHIPDGSIPGWVLDARTVVNIPQHNDLTQPDKKPIPSASVYVKYRLNPDGVAALRAWLDRVWDEALTAFQKMAEDPELEDP